MPANTRGTDPVFSMSNVGVSYRRKKGFLGRQKFWALEDVSFDLYAGESLGVIGKNGAGKSSLLSVMAGIIEPERGRITNGGCRSSLLSLQAGFSGYLTGRENAILSGMLLGMRRGEIEEKLPQVIEFSELGDIIDQPVNTYSTGMRVRLGFSVAFQVDTDILLLDEVLGVGDLDFKRKSTAAMRAKLRSQATVVLVSHNLETIGELCNRVLWIEKGRSIRVGKTEEVVRAYRENYPGKAGVCRGGIPHAHKQLPTS